MPINKVIEIFIPADDFLQRVYDLHPKVNTN